MNDDPSKSIDRRTSDELISDALKNPIYNEYAFGLEGRLQPLTTENLDASVRNSVEVHYLEETIGWPQEDNKVAPPYMYLNPSEFKAEIFSIHGVIPELEEAGADYDADILRKKQLNNLNSLFRANPAHLSEEGRAEVDDSVSMPDRIYSSTPAMIRAYAVAPDLMKGLHEALKDSDSMQATIRLYENKPEVVAAAYMAYRIMGRLVTENDDFLQAYIAGYADEDSISDFEPVTSSHTILTR